MAPGIGLGDRNAWDDTALINSWDEALAEYKKYHSIHAQGKRLEDVLSEDELKQLRGEHGDLIEEAEARSGHVELTSYADADDAQSNNGADALFPKVVEYAEKTHPERSEHGGGKVEEPTASGHQEQSRTAEPPAPIQDGALAASMPQAILGTVQDEELKNLMMSWYYAGYYTGLHTGRQQASYKTPQN